MDFDLFVIGGGSAGVRCGRISAGHGAKVAVAERRFWGGTCVNVGCVPKKLMVQAAEYGAWAEDARGFGWDIDVRGHDWGGLQKAVTAETERLSGIYRKLLDGAGARIFDASAKLIDAHTVEVAGERVSAKHIVIAAGGEAVHPTFPGAEHCLISDALFSMQRKPKSAVVIGGGYIACEFAGILAGLGVETTQIYRGRLFLRGFDPDIREALAGEMRAAGIQLRFDTDVTKVEQAGEGYLVHLTDNAMIEADAVFAAIGRRPATEGLGLEAAGVALRDNGAVLVDEGGRTSVPHIYALGDVTDQANLTPVATGQGHALADTLFGNNPRTISLENIPTAVFTAPPIGTVGLTEDEAAARGEIDVYMSRFKPLRHTITGRERRTLMKLVVDRASQRVLGVHMLGEDAGEILQGFAVAVVMGATKQDFDRTIGIHPSAAEEFVTMRTARPRSVAKAAE
ncbi:glutathione-disulfide reductase [Elioraea rosea]|uniref:glutathione-disulfide reductase n=1 Tax=Elioraea rosea TaxID=2492390 RepID=UPI0011828F2F|nr:glutathione-disulfide reductase [Elioraea rosea]